MIIGRAASIYDNKEATLTQSFGPEARGGACSAQVVISSEHNLYPYVTEPDILMVMSQPAYERFICECKPNALILYEKSLVKPKNTSKGNRVIGIPAIKFAEELKRQIVLNIVMVGFFTAMTDIITLEAVQKAVAYSVPKGTTKLNLDAFMRGFSYGVEVANH
jgi:2-oxoglutarate ferredoxin oxidoreductase subunit gamma